MTDTGRAARPAPDERPRSDTPRAWLAQGERIAVRNAPTHFGPLGYEIVSDVDGGTITVEADLPSRTPPAEVLVRLRHPTAAPIKGATVNGKRWDDFDPERELVRLTGLTGTVDLQVRY